MITFEQHLLNKYGSLHAAYLYRMEIGASYCPVKTIKEFLDILDKLYEWPV